MADSNTTDDKIKPRTIVGTLDEVAP